MTHSAQGQFRRDMLPDPETYFKQAGLALVGHGKQRQGPCPIHGGSDSLGVNVETGCWFCFSCGAKGGDVLDFHRQIHGLGFVEAARELGAWIGRDAQAGSWSEAATSHVARRPVPIETRSARRDAPPVAKTIFAEAQALTGTVGASYLASRGCALPPVDGDLRFHQAVRHESGHVGPALVAQITDAVTREPMGVHRTWVTPSRKADLPKPKMVLGPKKGGVIRLWPDDAVTTGLAIAEGIETALAVAHDYRPIWSVIDAGNMGAFPVLAGIETLVIAADNDAAGMKGALACADRWATAGVDVRVLVPNTTGADWNDVGVAQ
jgi:putative DNA primase/helicase